MLPPSLANILIRLHGNDNRTDSENRLYQELLFVSDSLVGSPINPSILHHDDDDSVDVRMNKEGRKRALINIAQLYADGRPVEVGPKVTGCEKTDCPLKKDWI